MVLDDDAALGNAGRAAGLENIDRLAGVPLGDPASNRAAAQPLVLEQRKLLQVIEALDLGQRIEVQFRLLFQPERAAGVIAEVPMNGLERMFIQPLTSLGCCLGYFWANGVFDGTHAVSLTGMGMRLSRSILPMISRRIIGEIGRTDCLPKHYPKA